VARSERATLIITHMRWIVAAGRLSDPGGRIRSLKTSVAEDSCGVGCWQAIGMLSISTPTTG